MHIAWSLYVANKIKLINSERIPLIMLPQKRASKKKSSDKTEFGSKALLLAAFPDHDLKFRSSVGKYTYYVCSRCQLRVAAQCTGEGERLQCATSLFSKQCKFETKLCSVCLQSECVYVCLPCMHKCTCASCAKQCRSCPICRQQVGSWKKVFDMGIAGPADDIAPHDVDVDPPTLMPASPVVNIPPSQHRDDAVVLSSSSEESDEYVPPPLHRDGPPLDGPRPQRQQLSDEQWVGNQIYSALWSDAALSAHSGDRGLALLLMQSLDWKLRTGALYLPVTRLVEMGFEEFPVRVCLLMHDGGESSALEELLEGGVYADVSGRHYVF